MTKSESNIAHYLGQGVPSAIFADDFEYENLISIAKTARACETELTITLSEQSVKGIIDEVCKKGKGYIRLDFRF